MMSILDEAAELASGPRQEAYGHPRDNHGCTAIIWWAYIQRRMQQPDFIGLDALDICWLHIFEKGIRDANRRKRDNLVDAAGYVENAERCTQ